MLTPGVLRAQGADQALGAQDLGKEERFWMPWAFLSAIEHASAGPPRKMGRS